jgi:hypothetical protein
MYGDDLAIVGGLARLEERPVMLIGHQKGRDTKERVRRNYGMPKPEGYRKALRLMKLAERFQIPLITLIDTPGAYPGVGSEERGQSEAIARNLFEMSTLAVPIVSVVIGEGGSGGALAIGVCDRLLMLQYSIYSAWWTRSFASRSAGRIAMRPPWQKRSRPRWCAASASSTVNRSRRCSRRAARACNPSEYLPGRSCPRHGAGTRH